jgi:hypothetical protein
MILCLAYQLAIKNKISGHGSNVVHVRAHSSIRLEVNKQLTIMQYKIGMVYSDRRDFPTSKSCCTMWQEPFATFIREVPGCY